MLQTSDPYIKTGRYNELKKFVRNTYWKYKKVNVLTSCKYGSLGF